MVKHAWVFAVLAGCIDSASTTTQPITPFAASDYLLVIGNHPGESHENTHNLRDMIFAWTFNSDDSADAVLATDCVGFGCHLEAVSATRQSSGDSTSVWRLSSDTPLAHAVTHGTSTDSELTVNLSSGGSGTIALRALLDCVAPPQCEQTHGVFCVPLCTLR